MVPYLFRLDRVPVPHEGTIARYYQRFQRTRHPRSESAARQMLRDAVLRLIALTGHFFALPGTAIMLDPKCVEEINAWIPEVIAASLARDIEDNLKAMVTAMSANLELVTHEDFDLQAQVLQRTRDKLEALAVRLARLGPGTKSGARSDPGA